MITLPPEEIMKQMAKIAVEHATQDLAVKAREFSKTLPPNITGREALEAFAAAIDSTNAKQFPKGQRS